VLYKKRGIGMFVATGARALLLERRREAFAQQFLGPLMAEARKLGVDAEQVKKLIDVWGDEGS
jgi:DNA-binding transcriptional regulator YhcF (GntR family)